MFSVDLDDCVSETLLSCVPLGKKGKNTSISHWPAPCMSLPFKTVNIESDSHSRHLAGFVVDLVSTQVRTAGICKPGAKLLDVVSSNPPPPGSCSVIIAGTNNAAVGQQRNMYQHLEQLITARLSAAHCGVVVATLPQRHDLPCGHPINEEIALVNAHIEELCFH